MRRTLASTGGVYKSTDRRRDMAISCRFTGSPARSVAVSPLTPGLVYADTDQGLFRSTDGGGNWSLIPSRRGKIVFDPVSASTVYLLSNPFSIARAFSKALTTGKHGLPMNKGLNAPLGLALVIDPVRPSTLHLASTPSGGFDAFVTKINPAGSALLYSTFIGGPLNTQNFSSISCSSFRNSS